MNAAKRVDRTPLAGQIRILEQVYKRGGNKT